MVTLYGISNCDTIKKAKKWLENNGVEFQFHDFRKDGLEKNQLSSWCKELNWETLLNKRGTTWRKLPDEVKNTVTEARAIKIMLEQPAIIKRPVLDIGNKRIVGFSVDTYKTLFTT